MRGVATSLMGHRHNESVLTLIADMPGEMDFRCNGPNNGFARK
jgi:hypothetical protein